MTIQLPQETTLLLRTKETAEAKDCEYDYYPESSRKNASAKPLLALATVLVVGFVIAFSFFPVKSLGSSVPTVVLAEITDLTTLDQRINLWEVWKQRGNSLVQDRLYLHTRHFSTKDFERHDFPIYLNHSDALAFLVTEGHKGAFRYSTDYFAIQQGSDAQINQAYCGVATSAALLNSLRGIAGLPQDPIYDPYPYATQTAMFNDCTSANVIHRNATFDGILSTPFGLNLEAVQALLKCHLPSNRWEVHATHVDTNALSLEDMRQTMKLALRDSNSRLMVNYERTSVGQEGGGHFSPIGAYSDSLDAFLVMDVAKYKYPNAWIKAETLYHSLGTIDHCATWDGPGAQAELPPSLLRPLKREDMEVAIQQLHCQSMPRGFIVISQK
jgi:hypothetical protein